jgi:hypothetical protein
VFAVAVSIAAFALAAAALAWIALRITESMWASSAAVFVFVINPNLLYLQSTPMTEPLMLGLTLAAVAMMIEWCADAEGGGLLSPSTIGIVFALACLTRYEAWPVTVTALAGAVWSRVRSGQSVLSAARFVGPIAAYPAAAVLGVLITSRIAAGEWPPSGFFVAENPALGSPAAAANQVLTGVRSLGGTVTTVVALVGLIGLLARALAADGSASVLVALAPAAAAALPSIAFFEGHPYRVRYMIPLLAAQAIGIGAAASRWRRATPAAAAVLMAVAALELAPMLGAAPMTAEAQWDLPNAVARRQVTACLTAQYDGTTIMASIGSLGHYMQELSHDGFRLRDFLHEGNGHVWLAAIEQPRPVAGWVLIEEYADGGDVLARTARGNPRWLDGFSRVCEGGGVALYRRFMGG